MDKISVVPRYGSISAIRDICEPWIDYWSGDEWGESMVNLHGAAKTSYGFSDEDCALFAGKLLENLIVAKEWADEYKQDKGYKEKVQAEARGSRDYWLAGGNLGDWGTTKEDAKSVIDQMPAWLFGEEE